jgi:hypothetical protein
MTIHTESTLFTTAEFATVSAFTDFLYGAIGGGSTIVQNAKEKNTLTETWSQLTPTSFKIVRDWTSTDEFSLYKAEVVEKLAMLRKHGILKQPDLYVETLVE